MSRWTPGRRAVVVAAAALLMAAGLVPRAGDYGPGRAEAAGAPVAHLVTKTEDTFDGACDADCSLREAVAAANATSGDDVVELPAGTYLLSIDTYLVADDYGSLEVAGDGRTTIAGAGRDVTVIDASTLRTVGLPRPDRVIEVAWGGALTITGVAITGGYTENATTSHRDGGGIWNKGDLELSDVLVEGNVAGVNGGGVANDGTATISDTMIRDNNTDPPDYTTSGTGGGVYNTGSLTVLDSTIESNASDNGGGLGSEGPLSGDSASLEVTSSLVQGNTARRGAGIFNGSDSTGSIVHSSVEGNLATRGWDTIFSNNRGGGVLNHGGDLTITDTTISANEAKASHHTDPASGGGGGVANEGGVLLLQTSTVVDNRATCDQMDPGDPVICGRGGGVVNAGGVADIVNTTITGNEVTLLNTGHAPYLGGGGGGGVAHMPQASGPLVTCPITRLDSVTITDNTADHGGGVNSRWESWGSGPYDVPELAVSGTDWPFTYECPDFESHNSIIAGNESTVTTGTDDSWGGFVSLGHNLVGDGTGAPSDGPGDLVAPDPGLAPLGEQGGPTETHALLASSPAINTGDTDLAVDQRGTARPQGAADDVGAFEVIPSGAVIRASTARDPATGFPDRIEGYGFAPDTTVTVTINGTPVADPPTTDTSGTFGRQHGDPDLDLLPGDVVEVSDGAATKSLTLVGLTFDELDHVGDTASGTSDQPDGTEVSVGVGDDSGGQEVSTTVVGGIWSAAFADDVTPDMTGQALITDADADETFADSPSLRGTAGDFTGDGATDPAVYRDGAWYVAGLGVQYLGLAGDTPVPADFSGDRVSQPAVFRGGSWFVLGEPTVFYGLPGDVPVPGDYDGDGAAQTAVWRPPTGGWFVPGESPVFYGLPGDIPVPGDYDGDGDVEPAVWRPATGGWFVPGQAPVFLGLSSDVPVPGDYDGDGAVEPAVWRTSTGGWFVYGQAPVFLGLSTDVPVPGDYAGDGDTDPAVYRAGTWFILGQPTRFLGLAGDRPVILPAATYDTYY